MKLWKRKDNVKGGFDRPNSLVYRAIFKIENESIIFSDRQTFVIENIKLVSVKTAVYHKILSTAESLRQYFVSSVNSLRI